MSQQVIAEHRALRRYASSRLAVRAFVSIFLFAVLTRSSPANAAPSEAPSNSPILVLEAHTGERPQEVSRFMQPLSEELEAHGFAARTETIVRLAGPGAPRPGLVDRDLVARQVAQDVDAANLQFTNGQYAAAAKILVAAIDSMHRNPAPFAIDTSNTDVMYKALATLSLCKKKLGDAAGAVATMKELIRMFPSRPLPRNKYGPSDEAFYREVYQQVQEMGRGRLSIAGGDSRAVLFVDGQIRGIGTTNLAGLIPGVYHVFVQVPQTLGRAYEVTVHSNGEAYLNAHYEIDSTLWVTDSWIGFQFATETERQHEARYAGEISRRWAPDSGKYAVIGTMQLQGKPALIGTIYASDGRVLLSAAVAFSEANYEKLRDLARFLANGTPAEGLQVVKGRDEPAIARTAPRRRVSRALPIVVIAVGALTIAAGSVMVSIDEDDDGSKFRYNDSAPAGVGLVIGGAIATGVGAFLWLRQSSRSGAPVVSIGSSSSFLGWAGRF
jgi:hypothetical protein